MNFCQFRFFIFFILVVRLDSAIEIPRAKVRKNKIKKIRCNRRGLGLLNGKESGKTRSKVLEAQNRLLELNKKLIDTKMVFFKAKTDYLSRVRRLFEEQELYRRINLLIK